MNKKVTLMVSLFLLCCICMSCFKTAWAAEYTSSEFVTDYYIADDSRIFPEGNNLIHIDWEIEDEEDIKKKDICKIVKTTIYENGQSGKKNVFKKKKTYPIKPNGSGLYAYCHEKNKLVIKMIDKKGKVKASYPIGSDKKEYNTVWGVTKKGNKLYCLVSTSKKVYSRCYDIKKKKVISNKKVCDLGLDNVNLYYRGNRLYCYVRGWRDGNGIVEERTLNGKKLLHTYQLPDGGTGAYPYTFRGICFKGRYIYYVNRNGVYRCDTKTNKQFELIYDGSGDVIFNSVNSEGFGLYYFIVLDNGDFYLFFSDIDHVIQKKYLYKLNDMANTTPQ